MQASDTPQDQVMILVAEPLTGRELEVLWHVSGMLRNSEIACEMHISVCSVKAHLKNIYCKLAATHRGDSLRRGRPPGQAAQADLRYSRNRRHRTY